MGLEVVQASNQMVAFGDILDSVIAGVDKQWTLAYRINYRSRINSMDVAKMGDGSVGANQRQLFAGVTMAGEPRLITYYALDSSAYRGVTADAPEVVTDADYCIVWVYDGSLDTNDGIDRFRCWVNGIERVLTLTYTYGALGNIPAGIGEWAIGGQRAGGSAANQCDCHYIADVILSDRLWTEADVAQYTWGNPALIPDLAFYAPLDHDVVTIASTPDIVSGTAGTTYGSPNGAPAPVRRS